MQTNKQLTSAFDHACTWNALLYTIHKIVSTGLTFLLFEKLSTDYFSLYANINSIIFLILLWTDCGFKKSIARFLPEYKKSGISLKTILHKLMVFKGTVLVCAIPICAYFIQKTCIFLSIAQYNHIIILAIIIFCIEGISLFLQLIYHAHFLHKYFNTISTIGLLAYSLSAFALCMHGNAESTLIVWLLYSKIITSACVMLAAYTLLWHVYPHTHNAPIACKSIDNSPQINVQFARHSTLMWLSTTLKSLTERNALLLLLTYFLGPAQANIFKVANESALFFYRIALKTIGTNDTTLLTQAKINKTEVNKSETASIFQHLKQKISVLCLGISIIFMPIFISKWYASTHIQSVQLFFIITICYLLEIFLSPYERILEVDQEYAYLFKAYVPYIMLLLLILSTQIITTMGLLLTIIVIHTTRITSAFLLAFYARKRYQESYTSTLNESIAEN